MNRTIAVDNQKGPAKGFIPGFGGAETVLAAISVMALLILMPSKKR